METKYKRPLTREFYLRDLKQKIIIQKVKGGYEVRYYDEKVGDYYKILEVFSNKVIF
jgi:hypothetical protein